MISAIRDPLDEASCAEAETDASIAAEPSSPAARMAFNMRYPFRDRTTGAAVRRFLLASLADLDRGAADASDRAGQQRIAGCVRRPRFASGLSMLKLFGLEVADVGREFGIVFAQLLELLGIMAVDLGF